MLVINLKFFFISRFPKLQLPKKLSQYRVPQEIRNAVINSDELREVFPILEEVSIEFVCFPAFFSFKHRFQFYWSVLRHVKYTSHWLNNVDLLQSLILINFQSGLSSHWLHSTKVWQFLKLVNFAFYCNCLFFLFLILVWLLDYQIDNIQHEEIQKKKILGNILCPK